MVLPGAPPGFQHRQAVDLGQADIEDHRVVGLGLAEIVPLLAVERAVHDIARVRQRGRELAVQIGVVLDDKKPQANLPALAREFQIDGTSVRALHLQEDEQAQVNGG